MICERFSRLTERSLRNPPKFLQTSQGELHKVLYVPFGYFRLASKIHVCTLKYSDLTTEVGFYGAFQEPCYEVLASMNPINVEKFQMEIGRCIWEAYDVEFWFIMKERAYQRRRNTQWDGFENVNLALASFPSTDRQYKRWSQSQLANPLFKTSTRFLNGTPEITDLGKNPNCCQMSPRLNGPLTQMV